MAEEDAEDYMADLSLFLPHPNTQTQICSDPISPNPQSSKRNHRSSKPSSWQQRRRIDRERSQREEDEQTLARCQSPIPASNVGFRLLCQMGYEPGSALGSPEPVALTIRRSRAGLGREDPAREKARHEEARAEAKRRRESDLMLDFGSRQKMQWRARRVAADYGKARKALAQLENEEVVEVEKGEGGDGDAKVEEGEEEEEEITEEDLHEILMKLRNEHHYCLYCGCQYESMEMLSSDCPGPNEEDH